MITERAMLAAVHISIWTDGRQTRSQGEAMPSVESILDHMSAYMGAAA